MQSISINGKTFGIPENQRGTIIDSGETAIYLPTAASTPITDAITQLTNSTQRFVRNGRQCYLINLSIGSIFPTVNLNFAGGGSMRLRPQDYLYRVPTVDWSEVWCDGFQEYSAGPAILGEIALKDKIIVYDLEGQRIGWSDYNCSSPISVSSTLRGNIGEDANVGDTSLHIMRYEVIQILILASILHLVVTVRDS